MELKEDVNERFLGDILKDSVRKLVSEKIELEIAHKISEFKKELEDRKDQYIAEVMKGIRICHERTMNGSNYLITFENVQRLER